MKTPSRYMPQYKEKQTGPIGWLFLVVFIGLVFWIIWSFPYLFLLFPIYLLVAIWEKNERARHFKDLLRDRDNDSICTFSRHFEYRQVDTWVIRAVYEQLQNYMNGEKENFPVRVSDDVFNDLMIDDEDFEYDLVEEIAQRTGRSLDNSESNPYYGKANIVENLVYFFNEQPKISAT